MADQVDDDIPDELTITLRKPVELAGITYAELKLREPTAAEWQQWDKLAGVAADIKAVSIVSGVPEPVVAKIGARDLTRAARYILRFLG
jgi:hypothetical protein